MRRLRARRDPRGGDHRPRLRLGELRLVDLFLLAHQAQHQIAPLPGPRGIAQRRIDVGRLDYRRDGGGLGQVQVAGFLSEVMAGRFAHARHRDRAVPPQVDLVQVGLEDLVLGVAGVQDHRQDRFDRLAPERALWGRVLWSQVEVLDELLRERGAALPGASLHV